MLPHVNLSGTQLILLGLSILAVAFLLRRTFVLRGKSQQRDTAAETRRDIERRERSAASGLHGMEVRLHDYQREVEGRLQTTLTLLERLIQEADEESRRLLELLQQSRDIACAAENRRAEDAPLPALTREDRQMVDELLRTGHTPAQVARLLRRDEREIADDRRPDAA